MLLEPCSVPCEQVVRLRNQFLCCFDLKQMVLDEFTDHLKMLEEETRDNHIHSIVSNTVNHPLIQRLALKSSYLKAFLKNLLEELEKSKWDCSPLYESYVNVLQVKEEFQYHYRHFCFDDRVVSIRENKSVISEGTTGLSVWQGGIALAQWCLDNTSIVDSQSVLELGSGLGLTGLVVNLSHCRPSAYCFSDSHPHVLDSIRTNLDLNNVKDKCEASISVLKLDWNDQKSWQCEPRPNVILAADIVYDPSLFPSIYKILLFFLKDCDAQAYIACTVRDENTFQLFIDGLIDNSLTVSNRVEIMPGKFFFSQIPPVILLSITFLK